MDQRSTYVFGKGPCQLPSIPFVAPCALVVAPIMVAGWHKDT